MSDFRAMLDASFADGASESWVYELLPFRFCR